MTESPDLYKLGYELGLQGEDLPDECLSLFSWAGWLDGLDEYARAITRNQDPRLRQIS